MTYLIKFKELNQDAKETWIWKFTNRGFTWSPDKSRALQFPSKAEAQEAIRERNRNNSPRDFEIVSVDPVDELDEFLALTSLAEHGIIEL